MQSENLAYQWNDVALLTDQRAYTFVCKTMLQIPKEQVEVLQEIILADWENKSVQEDTFDGSMRLQIGYLNQQKQQETLQVEIPLQGALEESLPQDANARLIYSKGKAAGTCLLLESVLQIPRFQSLQRSQVIVAPFQMEELLELPETWPACREVEATVAVAVLDEYQIQQQQLHLEGRYQLAVVYENSEQPGERLFVYQQERPMQITAAVPAGVRELERIVPYYQQITAQLLDERHIVLAGAGVLCTEAVSDSTITQQRDRTERLDLTPTEVMEPAESKRVMQAMNNQRMADVLQQLLEAMQSRLQSGAESAPAPAQEHLTLEDVTIQTGQPTAHPSVVNSRGSRRATLSKYMRNLNSSVQSPSITRNIEIGAEPESTEE